MFERKFLIWSDLIRKPHIWIICFVVSIRWKAMWWLMFYSHVENDCMTTSLHKEGRFVMSGRWWSPLPGLIFRLCAYKCPRHLYNWSSTIKQSGTGTSIQCGGIKLIIWSQISPLCAMMWSYNRFPHVSKTSTIT
jgi:hypothetical protein